MSARVLPACILLPAASRTLQARNDDPSDRDAQRRLGQIDACHLPNTGGPQAFQRFIEVMAQRCAGAVGAHEGPCSGERNHRRAASSRPARAAGRYLPPRSHRVRRRYV